MKHTSSGDSTLHRLGGLITRNFGLKMLSLALAIVIYVVLQAELSRAPLTEAKPQTPSDPSVSNDGKQQR